MQGLRPAVRWVIYFLVVFVVGTPLLVLADGRGLHITGHDVVVGLVISVITASAIALTERLFVPRPAGQAAAESSESTPKPDR